MASVPFESVYGKAVKRSQYCSRLQGLQLQYQAFQQSPYRHVTLCRYGSSNKSPTQHLVLHAIVEEQRKVEI